MNQGVRISRSVWRCCSAAVSVRKLFREGLLCCVCLDPVSVSCALVMQVDHTRPHLDVDRLARAAGSLFCNILSQSLQALPLE